MRIRLEYLDHNEEFARLLPQDGKIERHVSLADGNSWSLFHLDETMQYDGRSLDYFLLRSRWKGQDIGDEEPTSVFILLIDDVNRLCERFSTSEFEHVAWGMASTLGSTHPTA